MKKFNHQEHMSILWRLRAYKNKNDYFDGKHYFEKSFKRDIEAQFFSNILNNKNGDGHICYWENVNAT